MMSEFQVLCFKVLDLTLGFGEHNIQIVYFEKFQDNYILMSSLEVIRTVQFDMGLKILDF